MRSRAVKHRRPVRSRSDGLPHFFPQMSARKTSCLHQGLSRLTLNSMASSGPRPELRLRTQIVELLLSIVGIRENRPPVHAWFPIFHDHYGGLAQAWRELSLKTVQPGPPMLTANPRSVIFWARCWNDFIISPLPDQTGLPREMKLSLP
jgi:hypothetical protein